jgi:hypothetical protein
MTVRAIETTDQRGDRFLGAHESRLRTTEGLAEFHWSARTGYGIAEHWHAVSLG